MAIKKLRLGVIYAPQESTTKVRELKIMYKNIENQIEESEKDGSNLIIVGDFNCTIGNCFITNNNTTITKGGRILMKMVQTHNLII